MAVKTERKRILKHKGIR